MASVSLAYGDWRHSREVRDDHGRYATVSEGGDESSTVGGETALLSAVHA
ncbi:hypothetical protein [Mycobacteroides chelonae]|nr:hypothetical protein [Mycobacteroides chelonae]